MHFSELTRSDNKKIIINMANVVLASPLECNDVKSRLFFNYDGRNYIDVKETLDEIFED